MNNLLEKIKTPMILEAVILIPFVVSIATTNFIGNFFLQNSGCFQILGLENCALEMEILSLIAISFVFSSWVIRILLEHINNKPKQI